MRFCSIVSVVLCLLFFSCDKKEDWNPVKLDKVELEFLSEGGTEIATLQNYSSWQVKQILETIGNAESRLISFEADENGRIKGDWFVIEHTDNPKQISVTLDPNMGDARQIAITVTVDDNGTNILAKQATGK